MNIECRQYEYASKEYQAALDLRTKVLREPLGLKFNPDDLKLEADAFHFGAFIAGALIGTLMLVRVADEDDALRMRQVAVSAEAQSKGVGKALVAFAEHFSLQNGIAEIRLHARDTAVPFYLALGYEKFGDVFYEVTIPHYEMIKAL